MEKKRLTVRELIKKLMNEDLDAFVAIENSGHGNIVVQLTNEGWLAGTYLTVSESIKLQCPSTSTNENSINFAGHKLTAEEQSSNSVFQDSQGKGFRIKNLVLGDFNRPLSIDCEFENLTIAGKVNMPATANQLGFIHRSNFVDIRSGSNITIPDGFSFIYSCHNVSLQNITFPATSGNCLDGCNKVKIRDTGICNSGTNITRIKNCRYLFIEELILSSLATGSGTLVESCYGITIGTLRDTSSAGGNITFLKNCQNINVANDIRVSSDKKVFDGCKGVLHAIFSTNGTQGNNRWVGINTFVNTECCTPNVNGTYGLPGSSTKLQSGEDASEETVEVSMKTGEVREFSRLLNATEENTLKVVSADGRLIPDDPKFQKLKDFLMNKEDAGDFVVKDIGVSRIMWSAFPTGEGEIYWSPNWDNNDDSTKNHMVVTSDSGEFLRLENFPEINSAWSNWSFRFRIGDWIFANSGYRGVQKFNIKTKEKLIYPLPYTDNAAEIFLAGDKVFYFAPTFALGKIWILDVNSLEFEELIVPTQAYRLPVVQGDSLYLIGGPQGFNSPTTANSIIRIHLKTFEITEYAYPESGMPLTSAIYHSTRQGYIFPRATASTSLRVFQVYGGTPMWGTISGLPSRIHKCLVAVGNSVYVTSGNSGDTTIVELAFQYYWTQTVMQHTVTANMYSVPKVLGADIYYNSGNYTSGTIPIIVFDTVNKSIKGQLTTTVQRESFVYRDKVYIHAASTTQLTSLPLSKIDPVTLQVSLALVQGLPASWRYNTINTPAPGLFYAHWNEGSNQVNSSKILIGVHQTPKLSGGKYIHL